MVEQVREAAVHPIGRERVLGKVVRAETQEVDDASDLHRAQRRRGDLHHRADRRQAMPPRHPRELLRFPRRRDHRCHDPQVGSDAAGLHRVAERL